MNKTHNVKYNNIEPHNIYFIGLSSLDNNPKTKYIEYQNMKYEYFTSQSSLDEEPQNIHTSHFVGRTSRDTESNYLEMTLPPIFNKFLDAVKKEIKYRSDHNKNDAYFEVPEKITYEQLLILIKKINRFDNESICTILTESNKIYVSWHNSSTIY